MEKLVEKLNDKGKVKGYELQDENGNFLDYFKFATHKQWHEALQEAPSPAMIKERKLDKKQNGKVSRYVPITIQESLSEIFFRECDIIDETIHIYNHEIQEYNSTVMKPNSQVIMHIKISILPNYPNAEHRTICGTAAKTIQSKANSLEYNSPSVQSAAKSNALTMFANIFGRNLNRDFDNNYSFSGKDKEPEQTSSDTQQTPQ